MLRFSHEVAALTAVTRLADGMTECALWLSYCPKAALSFWPLTGAELPVDADGPGSEDVLDQFTATIDVAPRRHSQRLHAPVQVL